MDSKGRDRLGETMVLAKCEDGNGYLRLRVSGRVCGCGGGGGVPVEGGSLGVREPRHGPLLDASVVGEVVVKVSRDR